MVDMHHPPPGARRGASLEVQPSRPIQMYVITYAAMASGNGSSPDHSIVPRLHALRDAMGLSLRELAERTGVSAPMLSQVERGETSPTLSVAGRIASGLELSLSQLL